jgi:hypothetical protein
MVGDGLSCLLSEVREVDVLPLLKEGDSNPFPYAMRSSG